MLASSLPAQCDGLYDLKGLKNATIVAELRKGQRDALVIAGGFQVGGRGDRPLPAPPAVLSRRVDSHPPPPLHSLTTHRLAGGTSNH
jgi:hypothetical protein